MFSSTYFCLVYIHFSLFHAFEIFDGELPFVQIHPNHRAATGKIVFPVDSRWSSTIKVDLQLR